MKTINDILTNAIEANQEEQRLYGCCQAAQVSAELTWHRLTQATPAAFIRKVNPDEVFSGSLDLDHELDDLALARGIRPNLQDRWKKQTAVVLRADAPDGQPQFSLYRLAKTRNNELTIHIYRELVAGALDMINHYAPAMLAAEKKREEVMEICETLDPVVLKAYWSYLPALLGSTDEMDRQNFGDSIDVMFWDQAINHALDHEYKDMESIPAGKLLQTVNCEYQGDIAADDLREEMSCRDWQYNQADNTFTKH
ncbi:hypothetical protein LOB57_06750 [Lactobacillus delbrueckii subsp. lactis]|uniref:hypothetical protein n=1 Tax=Lactobacillus delbrueckii TaxID=1584 RepID=UPI001E65DD3C|nr:hypothetical protein [Lactobacillus delbrueckii]MCD5569635.1 hypothetical protein [Lactobacillus delbrueckii subsp. lactis]